MHEKSINILNQAIADELTAIHQYMYFHFHCDDQGYEPLAAMFKKTAIEEMMHAERLGERILFLKGDVEMKPSREVEKVNEVPDMLAKAMEMEQMSVQDYNRFALECSANADSASKQVFETLVGEEEGHFDEFDKQLDNIKRFGPSYLALQSFDGGAAPAGAGG